MDQHITRHLLHAIHQGWRNPGDLAAIGLAHLFEHCHVCREEFESWRRQAGEGVARPEGGDFDAALDRVCGEDGAQTEELEAEAARVESERRQARSRAEQLLALAADDRIDWIRAESQGHAGPLLAEALIEESRRQAAGDAEATAGVLLKLSRAHRQSAELERSLSLLDEAEDLLISQKANFNLIRCMLGAKVVFLTDKGHLVAARRHLEALMAVPRPDAVAKLRARWAQADVLKGLNETEAAKESWLSISQEFQALGLQYDSALASLQAAGLAGYLGLLHDAEQLAADTLPVFQRLGVQVKAAEARQLRDRAAAGGTSVVTPD